MPGSDFLYFYKKKWFYNPRRFATVVLKKDFIPRKALLSAMHVITCYFGIQIIKLLFYVHSLKYGLYDKFFFFFNF